MERKIKVAWICDFSNKEVREHLKYNHDYGEDILRRMLNKPYKVDYARWITNGIKQFEKQNEVELHIISPCLNLKPYLQEFDFNGIKYHFFNSDSYLSLFQKCILRKKIDNTHTQNRQYIKDIIERVIPDIIHLVGAENPQYSMAGLDVDTRRFPLIVGLQTLLSAPGFLENYPMSKTSYEYKSNIERKVISRSTYLMSTIPSFKRDVWHGIKENAVFLNSKLFVGENINIEPCEKKYDFEYNAVNINKAVDLAIESFALAVKQCPKLTLHIVGGYSFSYKKEVDRRIEELGLSNNVSFTGSLPTHGDVIKEIRKARFALLPVKVDYVAGTIREAMANGLPVISTITDGTPTLNLERQSILLSPIGDHHALADNIIKLIESKVLQDKMRENAYKTCEELYGNRKILEEHLKIYNAVYLNKTKGIPIPDDLCDTYEKWKARSQANT